MEPAEFERRSTTTLLSSGLHSHPASGVFAGKCFSIPGCTPASRGCLSAARILRGRAPAGLRQLFAERSVEMGLNTARHFCWRAHPAL